MAAKTLALVATLLVVAHSIPERPEHDHHDHPKASHHDHPKSASISVDGTKVGRAKARDAAPANPPSERKAETSPVDGDSSGDGSGGGAFRTLCLMLLVGGAFACLYQSYGSDFSRSVNTLSGWGLQLGSFFILVAVQSCALLLFKACQSSGAYAFSPASSVALTEACKLALAGTLHWRAVQSSGAPFLEHLSPRICAHYFGLAILYTVNNQLTFYCFEIVDPGTFTLGKSLAPYLVAVLLRFFGQSLNELQWVCVLLQCICIAVSQYDACKGAGVLPMKGYILVGVATVITAASSVWNQKIVKGFTVPVNLQNTILYVFGFIIAVISYIFTPAKLGVDGQVHGFFYGYGALAVMLVLFQAFHGLAVTLVYKYADAIVKNFANSAVMAILVVLSAYLFNTVTSFQSYLGVAGVLVTTYAYMNIALRM